nr:phage tail tube protein [Bacillus subtilis]
MCSYYDGLCEKGNGLYFTLQAVLDDASSGRGTERVIFYDVGFDSAKITGREMVPFTFEDFDVPEQLKSTF